MSPRPQAILSIIRKDLQLLWPLALTIVIMQFLATAFFHEVTELIGTDRSAAIQRGGLLFWLGALLPPLLSAIFIFLAVQADIATDTRHDWLTRPVSAIEIVVAKIALVLGVVLAPYFAGNVVFMLTTQADPAAVMLPVIVVLRNCLFGILLAWLVSSALQGVLAMVGLMTMMSLAMAVIIAVLAAFYYAGRVHAGLPPGGPPQIIATPPTWGRVSIQLAIQAAVMWPVLWLLLVRRRTGMARLVFAIAYVVGATFPFAQYKMAPPATTAQVAHAVIETPVKEATPE